MDCFSREEGYLASRWDCKSTVLSVRCVLGFTASMSIELACRLHGRQPKALV